ncbi:MAG TPA: cytochrome c biogenesis protein CcdA [Methanosarcinaceae archaeon]|nr:cytochrome c biogenesis protein CcdA [Methanosarcinaceae archaeon]
MIKRCVLQRYATNSVTFGIIFLLTLSVIFLMPTPAAGQSNGVVVEYFYEEGCLKCERAAPVLDDVINGYENISYSKYEIWSDYNGMKAYDRMINEYGIAVVPAIVVNQQTVISYSDYNNDIDLLEEILVAAIDNAPSVPDVANNNPVRHSADNGVLPKLSIWLVFIAGLMAGFNPCLLAVMAFLASITMSSKGNRIDLIKIVVGFCFGIFATYMAVGLGLLSVVKQYPDIGDTITFALVLLIGFLGLWHFYDAYRLKYHFKSSFKTPESFIRLLGELQNRNTLLVSVFAGAIFSLVKAPCVGAVYFAIIDLIISKEKVAEGAMYLFAYNFGVILPVLLLGFLLIFGLSPERVDELRENRRVEIRVITGVVLLLLALLMYFNII